MGMSVGVDRVIAECTPEDKVRVVREAREPGTVFMAGDGVNDAPALASADVGVALAGERVSAASETADVVLVANRLDRLAPVVSLARYARRIARQSVALGMGLSVIGMAAAAAGFIIPAVGALLQEAIDVLAVANALRVLLYRQQRPSPRVRALSLRFEAEHEAVHRGVDEIVRLADSLEHLSPVTARRRLRAVARFLIEELLPHEWTEGTQLYPAINDEACPSPPRPNATSCPRDAARRSARRPRQPCSTPRRHSAPRLQPAQNRSCHPRPALYIGVPLQREVVKVAKRPDRLIRRASWLAPCTGLLLGCLAANALIAIAVGIIRVSHWSPSTRHSRYLWSKCLAS